MSIDDGYGGVGHHEPMYYLTGRQRIRFTGFIDNKGNITLSGRKEAEQPPSICEKAQINNFEKVSEK